jgi:hypothetical protein
MCRCETEYKFRYGDRSSWLPLARDFAGLLDAPIAESTAHVKEAT